MFPTLRYKFFHGIGTFRPTGEERTVLFWIILVMALWAVVGVVFVLAFNALGFGFDVRLRTGLRKGLERPPPHPGRADRPGERKRAPSG